MIEVELYFETKETALLKAAGANCYGSKELFATILHHIVDCEACTEEARRKYKK